MFDSCKMLCNHQRSDIQHNIHTSNAITTATLHRFRKDRWPPQARSNTHGWMFACSAQPTSSIQTACAAGKKELPRKIIVWSAMLGSLRSKQFQAVADALSAATVPSTTFRCCVQHKAGNIDSWPLAHIVIVSIIWVECDHLLDKAPRNPSKAFSRNSGEDSS